MVDTGVAIRGGKVLTEGGVVNISSIPGGCDECCCNECEFCDGCTLPGDSPGCPPNCCTPDVLDVNLSGWDVSLCTNCFDCTPATLESMQFQTLNIDGNFCLDQDITPPFSNPCRYKIKILNAGIIKCHIFTNNCSDSPTPQDCVFDLTITVERINATTWEVKMVMSFPTSCGPPPACGSLLDFTTFKTTRVEALCKTAFSVTQSASCTCSLGPSNGAQLTSAGTVTVTPCGTC